MPGLLSSTRVRVILGLSLVLHLCAAWFSVGYNWFDEYFQIVEFAGLKLGRTPEHLLSWEYGSRVRPWLEPAILYLISAGERALGISSPATWLFSFQLLGAVLGWLSVLALVDCARRWIADGAAQRLAILSLGLFWFFPWFHARTSSENFSSSAFYFGLWLWVARPAWLEERARDAAAGALWAFAFFFRNQVGAMIIGGGLWLLKERRVRAWPALAGFAAAFAVGTLADRWGYGIWTAHWYNYLVVCVLQGKAASFGTTPWWDYFRLIWLQAPPVLGLLAVVATIGFWALRPRHIVTWITLPFALLHLGLGHKELRYLFPIVPLVPILPWLLLEGRSLAWPRRLALALLVVDVPYLLLGTFSAEKNSFGFLNHVAGRYPADFELLSLERDPFEDISTLFYLRPDRYRFKQISQVVELELAIATRAEGAAVHYFHNRTEMPEPLVRALVDCVPEYRAFGPAYRAVDFNGWLSRAANWQLWRCGQ